MATLEARLKALEAQEQSAKKRQLSKLSVLVLDSPTALQEVAAWRAKGFEAYIDGPDDPWTNSFIG